MCLLLFFVRLCYVYGRFPIVSGSIVSFHVACKCRKKEEERNVDSLSNEAVINKFCYRNKKRGLSEVSFLLVNVLFRSNHITHKT